MFHSNDAYKLTLNNTINRIEGSIKRSAEEGHSYLNNQPVNKQVLDDVEKHFQDLGYKSSVITGPNSGSQEARVNFTWEKGSQAD